MLTEHQGLLPVVYSVSEQEVLDNSWVIKYVQ